MRHPILLCLLLVGCPTADDDDTANDDDAANDDDTLDDDDAWDDDDIIPDDDDDTVDDDDSGPALDTVEAILAWIEAPTTSVDDVDGFQHEVAWGDGWPWHLGDDWLFLTRWDSNLDGVSVVGDMNGWDTAAHPAVRAASGRHYLSVVPEGEFIGDAAGAKYKWFDEAKPYRVGPEATAYGFDQFGRFGYVAPPTGEVWREQFPAHQSGFLDAPRGFRALLPAGFQALSPSASALRTLVAQDGQNIFDEDGINGGWGLDVALVDEGISDVIVLGIDNGGDRIDAYTHVDDELPTDGTTVGGRAADYASLVYQEALPFFRARYGLVAEGDSLAVMGSSLGGLVSLYLAMAHPDEQACVMALSSTLGWGAFGATRPGDQALARLWPDSYGHGGTAIYLDSGGSVNGACGDVDGDGVHEDSEDSDNYCATNQMRDVLDGLGYTFEQDLWHWHEPFASHTESAWGARVPRALAACSDSGWVAP